MAKSTAKRRLGLSLGSRIFLLIALVILVSVGSAVVFTSVLGDRIARDAIAEALSSSNSVQSSFRLQRYEQLKLISRLFVGDANLTAYLAEAATALDTASILDLLAERQDELGYDFAIVLDPQGRVLARTDQPGAAGDDLSRRSLVAQALREYEASGVWQERGRLYYAVAVPVVKEFDLLGFFVTGLAVDDALALEVKKMSNTETAFLASTQGGPELVATTLDSTLAEKLLTALKAQGDVLRRVITGGETVDQLELSIDGSPWLALLSPLKGAADEPVGGTVALASLDRELATYRQIERVLIGVGVLSILFSFVVSYFLSRRTLKPLRQLAAVADAARQGNYDQQIKVSRSDEVGQLAQSLDTLLSDLREKRDMEAYVSELARTMPEPGAAPAGPPRLQQVTLLAIELRRFAHPSLHADAETTVDKLGQDLRRIAAAVAARQGHIEAMLGHRVLASFEGGNRSQHALAAAAEVVRTLSVRESAFDEGDDPAAALVTGQAVTGSVVWGESPQRAIVGLPVQQMENLLREATPGDILLTEKLYEELQPAFKEAGQSLESQRGLLSTQRIYLLDAALAGRVTGLKASATAITAHVAPTLPGGPTPDKRATLSEIAPGSLLGDRFEVLAMLGAGGMGVVYKARDRELDDVVALKMLRKDVSGDEDHLARLKSELKLARRITHPNVLRTFDFGEVDGVAYISMEYVRGVTLRYLLDQTGRLPYSAGLRLAKQLAAGLGAAHGVGVIHRDIKPENLILEQNGNAKLMDFGIARPVKRATPGQTQAGWIVGTPHYLSPEQLEGKEPDQRADIYACGVVLYELFTGKLPFQAENPMQVILKHLNEEPAPPSTHWADIPRDLEALIMRCLEKDRDRRFKNVGELARKLEELRS